MKDWYEELARLIGRVMADEWMKIIARRQTKSQRKTCSLEQATTDRPTELPSDRDERQPES